MQTAPFAHLHSPQRDGAAAWSFAPSRAIAWLICRSLDEPTRLFDHSGLLREWESPLRALAWMEQFELGREINSRWIGYLSYDLGRLFEQLPTVARDDLDLPLLAFGFHPPPAHPFTPKSDAHLMPPKILDGTFVHAGYLAAIERVLNYIRAGDVFQINLSQRFQFTTESNPADLWQRAIEIAPAELGAYLDFGEFSLISLSPELLMKRDGRRIITRPIKGTRPREAGLDAHLRDSAKDRAELNMIVDLERNDLGRICEIGSVHVTQPPQVEAHPTVYHGVAEIGGTLRDGVGLPEILRAMFPGGSITGAPKVRAMQIIEELEPVRRGPYCGAIGYLAADGSMQFNVAIRTMVLRDGMAYVPVGGGIVADSDPRAEYEETLVKARAMLSVLGVDEDDFRRRCYGT